MRSLDPVWECNVFSHICLSVCSRGKGFHVTITHDALDLNIQGPPSPAPPLCTGTFFAPAPALLLVTSGGEDQRPIQTCSLEDPPGADIRWLATEACMVGEHLVHILLEYLLVCMFFR